MFLSYILKNKTVCFLFSMQVHNCLCLNKFKEGPLLFMLQEVEILYFSNWIYVYIHELYIYICMIFFRYFCHAGPHLPQANALQINQKIIQCFQGCVFLVLILFFKNLTVVYFELVDSHLFQNNIDLGRALIYSYALCTIYTNTRMEI